MTEHRTAVVTGAASGIGRALATRLAAAATRLVLADVDAAALADVAAALGAKAVPTDVTDLDAMKALAAAATFPGTGAYGASKHAVVAVAEQAALALADTSVGVTVLCPALVRTAMSPVGDDPADVAEEALTAVRNRAFAVLPTPWKSAVRQRAEHLASGRPPAPPAPA